MMTYSVAFALLREFNLLLRCAALKAVEKFTYCQSSLLLAVPPLLSFKKEQKESVKEKIKVLVITGTLPYF